MVKQTDRLPYGQTLRRPYGRACLRAGRLAVDETCAVGRRGVAHLGCFCTRGAGKWGDLPALAVDAPGDRRTGAEWEEKRETIVGDRLDRCDDERRAGGAPPRVTCGG